MGDPVLHPKHYTSHKSGVECLEIVSLLGFCLGNAVKYVWRFDQKNGIEDLKKSVFYFCYFLSSALPISLPTTVSRSRFLETMLKVVVTEEDELKRTVLASVLHAVEGRRKAHLEVAIKVLEKRIQEMIPDYELPTF